MLSEPDEPATTLPDLDDLRARLARFEAIRSAWLTQLRAPRGTWFHLVAHNEIAGLNAELEIVRAVNAWRRPYHRSSEVSAWPVPVIRSDALLSQRDLLPTLDRAIWVLASVISRAATCRARVA